MTYIHSELPKQDSKLISFMGKNWAAHDVYIYISCPRLVDLSPYALLSIHITLRFRKVGLAACVLHVASGVPIKDCRCPVGYVIGMVDVV
jgi:hypothetical protein